VVLVDLRRLAFILSRTLHHAAILAAPKAINSGTASATQTKLRQLPKFHYP